MLKEIVKTVSHATRYCAVQVIGQMLDATHFTEVDGAFCRRTLCRLCALRRTTWARVAWRRARWPCPAGTGLAGELAPTRATAAVERAKRGAVKCIVRGVVFGLFRVAWRDGAKRALFLKECVGGV